MARLIDDLRAAGRITMPHYIAPWLVHKWDAYARQVMQIFRDPQLPVLLIENVAKYYFEENDQEYWSLDKDFPNMAPPYPQFWMEHKLPRQINSKTMGVTDVTKWTPNGRVGMLFTAVDPADAKAEGDPPAGTRWIVWMELFVDYGSAMDGIQGPHGATFVCIDAEGQLLGVPFMQSYAEPGMEQLMKSVMTWFHPGFLAVSFLHCKNVVLEEHVVDAPLQKKWRARHGFDQTPYHTLVIEPLKAILRKEGRAHEHGAVKAMHICRGHFADYREGRGLFGKYHGRYWMPSTVRGTKGKAAPPREMEVKV